MAKRADKRQFSIFPFILAIGLCSVYLISTAETRVENNAKTPTDVEEKVAPKNDEQECTPDQTAMMMGGMGMGTGGMGGGTMGPMGTGGMGGMGGTGTGGMGMMGSGGMMTAEDDTLIPEEAEAHTRCGEKGNNNLQ